VSYKRLASARLSPYNAVLMNRAGG
jgi:hypothetical protein